MVVELTKNPDAPEGWNRAVRDMCGWEEPLRPIGRYWDWLMDHTVCLSAVG